MASDKHRFVVGVDFGTTYSGVAYSHTSNPGFQNIKVITTWPGVGNANHLKAPTEICYTGTESEWGYEIEAGQDVPRYNDFKLLLDPDAVAARYHDSQPTADPRSHAAIPLPPRKSAEDVTSDYLKHLYQHIIDELQKLAIPISITPIQFVLTTPAIWSHKAQNATREAARKAGFASRSGDILTMVSEPEAAGTYVIAETHSLQDAAGVPLQVGERIVICDAGGGTVDLSTYIVDRVDPLRLREAAVGSGAKCGSRSLDVAFLDLVKSRVGEAFERWPAKRTSRGSRMMGEFETAKREFGTRRHTVPWLISVGALPDNPKNGIKAGSMKLTSEDMKGIFDPVVKKITDMIGKQLEQSILGTGLNTETKIFLVGGFGQSSYLFKEVGDWAARRNARVINPSDSWSAIARGAVLHGLEGIVHTHKLKRHYGMILGTPFIPGIHAEKKAYIDLFTGIKHAGDNVRWLAAMGSDVTKEKYISIPCSSSFGPTGEKSVTISLVGCEFQDPPTSSEDCKATTLGTVICDLRDLPPSASQVKRTSWFFWSTEPGPSQVTFSVNMRVGSADLGLEIVHGGKTYGGARIEYPT